MARTHYKHAVTVGDKYNDAYCKLAVQYRTQDERNKSIDLLRQAISLQPTQPEVHENLSMLLLDEQIQVKRQMKQPFSESIQMHVLMSISTQLKDMEAELATHLNPQNIFILDNYEV